MYKNIHAAVAGSINTDLILRAERMPESGENLTGIDYGYSNGGKGANQATGLARLGAKTKLIGKVGNDGNGRQLIANLRNNGVDVSCISTDGSQTGLAAILLDGNGSNRIIVYEGANAEIDPEKAASFITDELDLLLVQFETDESVVAECVNKAVSLGITTVVDCGPAKAFELEKMQGVTIITPNESETRVLTGIEPVDEASALEASRILMQRSKARYVVLKLGSRGCCVWNGSELRMMPAYKSRVVDTTAAGDCFTAAMALEYVRSGDIYASCDIGNKAGSISVGRMGACDSMPTADEIKNFKSETEE